MAVVVMDRKVDARSDLYAVGALGFLMLTGKLVFDKDNLDAMLQKIVNSDPPRPSECTEKPIPKELDDLIFACLARDPDQRPTSAEELAEKLARLPLDREWTAQDASRWWQEKSKQIEFERKLERPERGSISETVMDIDFGDRT